MDECNACSLVFFNVGVVCSICVAYVKYAIDVQYVLYISYTS